jgi:aryl-alcohol dehydrogenase-like predicted oxidoreductase
MRTLPLGASPVQVSRVIHGCMGFSDDRAAAIRAMHASFEAGVTSFDTAPLYGFGRNEEALAEAIADRRARVQVLTKLGLRWDAAHGRVLFEAVERDGARKVVRRDSRAESVKLEVERSLARLRVDALDLVQVHHRDLDTPIAETMAALEALVREGKVRAVGVSNYSGGELEEAAARLGGTPLASAQLEYSLLARGIEKDQLPWARGRGVAVLAYSPLAHGVLAGRQLGARAAPADWRRGTVYFSPQNLAAINDALARAALPIAAARGVDVAQVCLAWVLAQPGVTAVIAGAGTPEQARANVAAAALGLEPAEVESLSSAFGRIVLAPPPNAGGGVVGRVRGLLSRLRDVATSVKER